jgi:hypothetical protein
MFMAFLPLLLDLPSEPLYIFINCLGLLLHLGPMPVQLLEKPSGHRLTHHLSHWRHELQVNVGLPGQLVSVPPC